MKQAHILLVEDELHIAQGLVFNLEAEGYRVTHVERCADALNAYAAEKIKQSNDARAKFIAEMKAAME